MQAALLWAVACSLLFVIVYGGCEWIAARRPDVGVFYFQWELLIPFVPAMIVPYWSLDIFFVASFLLCRNRAELSTLGKRIVIATLVAGTCFVLMPLRVAFPRPEVSGFFGLLFGLLRAFDQPHNLVPSLHIAYLAILGEFYARHTRGTLRALVLRPAHNRAFGRSILRRGEE